MTRAAALALLVAAALAPPAQAGDAARPTEPLLARIRPAGFNDPFHLARLDPLTLRPVGRTVEVAYESHDAWSLSPDGRHVAFGISAPGRETRIGIRVVDTQRMAIVSDVETGVYADGLLWARPRRLVALVGSGGVGVVDPLAPRILVRRNLPLRGCDRRVRDAATPEALVVLEDSRRPGLHTMDAGGRLASMLLRAIQGDCDNRLGFAVDRERRRAYVVGPGAEAAEVDLPRMRAAYRTVGTSRLGARGDRDAVVLAPGRLAVALLKGIRPRGAELVDLAAGRRRPLDRRAGGVVEADGRALVFDGSEFGAGIGVRAFGPEGRQRWHLLRGERVWSVLVAGRFAYARSTRGLRVIDARAGEVVARAAPSRDEIELLLPPDG